MSNHESESTEINFLNLNLKSGSQSLEKNESYDSSTNLEINFFTNLNILVTDTSSYIKKAKVHVFYINVRKEESKERSVMVQLKH